MKKLILILIIVAGFCILTLPAFAAEDPTATASQEFKKIKELLEKNATVSGQKTENPETAGKFFAWVGTLKKAADNILTVATEDEEKEAEVDSKTTILQTEKGKSRKEVKVSELKTGNFMIVIGTMDSEKIKATRVISAPAETEIEKKVVFGKVTEADEEKIKLSNGESNTLSLTSKTNIKINGFAKTAKISDIELEDKVFAVVVLKDGQISETKAIFVLPGKNAPQPTSGAEATPSATATPSASPKK